MQIKNTFKKRHKRTRRSLNKKPMSLAPTDLLVDVPVIIPLILVRRMVNCVCAQLAVRHEDSWWWRYGSNILDLNTR
jgi:hypothetical protein